MTGKFSRLFLLSRSNRITKDWFIAGSLGGLGFANDVLIRVDCDTLCAILGLVNADEMVGQLEHVVSEADDDELGVLGAFFDVVSYNGDILKVQCRVNLVHKVQRSWLVVMQSKDKSQRAKCLEFPLLVIAKNKGRWPFLPSHHQKDWRCSSNSSLAV